MVYQLIHDTKSLHTVDKKGKTNESYIAFIASIPFIVSTPSQNRSKAYSMEQIIAS